jgi:GH15 family glucan-1,4-alpha-glucosidase
MQQQRQAQAGQEHQPLIADYACIGDCRSIALVSRWGGIDWFCSSVFSGPSVFAALLDVARGGRFSVAPPAHALTQEPRQSYLEGSNVLCTRFECADGVLLVTDFMTVPEAGSGVAGAQAAQEIVRIMRCLEGHVPLQVRFDPRPGYATETVEWKQTGPHTWAGHSPGTELGFACTLPVAAGQAGLTAQVTLQAGDEHVALMRCPGAHMRGDAGLLPDAQGRLAATLAWWRLWSQRCTYDGPYREPVLRSALTLKLLAYRPTGAIVAAGTTSLPEGPSGARNWDYRYCWLRDTSLVLHGFIDLGYFAESDAFLRWLLHATRSTRPLLQVVYDVHGEHHLPEKQLTHLSGYHGIGPVRIGNAASEQVQHDIYGELLLTAHDHAARGGTLDRDEGELLADLVHTVCGIWRQPDQGIWEVRVPPRHNTHSKLMCWAALDRGLALQQACGIPIDTARVERERAAVRADIEAHGFHPGVGSYVGYYGSDAADASLLMMPRLGYLPADDPRMLGTVHHIFSQLSTQGFLYRYPPNSGYDGVAGSEHLFAICNFWAVDCLARQGRLTEATALYEKLLALRNHAGLYAEEFSVKDGSPIGNFPQAFSHVGLITAALSLAAASGAPAPS